MIEEPLTIPGRCNGPPDSANGGYACGLVAERIGGAAEVSLRTPPPLDRPMRVERDGETVRVLDGTTLVLEGEPGDPAVTPPLPPSFADAERVSALGEERWGSRHPFPTCVTCGPLRAPGDGLRVFPAALPGGGTFAATWSPHHSLADEGDTVPGSWVWAALDCPTSAPVIALDDPAPHVLARLTASIEAPVEVGEPHVIVSWLLDHEGRKLHSAAALYTAAGELRARSRALWIELRPR